MEQKMFANYLLKNSIINDSDLLAALLEQIKTLPDTIEILAESKIIDDDSLLKIILCQSNEQLDTISALKKTNLWTQDIETQINEQISKKRKPLVEILIKQGKFTPEELVQHLDNYIYEQQQNDTDIAS